MKLMFLGAAHEVTGSCTYLQCCGKNILIDCGMEQGIDSYENVEIPIPSSEIDYCFLTHAHIDHSGMLPLLYANGFRGTIFATDASCDLCDIMLRDSAHIQEFEAEWRNRKGKRSGKEPYVPIYNMNDALGAIGLFKAIHYDEKAKICD
ncbi:MAG: MBL fold metallo-hydrolase, partial [Oscillospiraceae bacterium]